MQEMREMWVRSLGQEEPLEEGTATHSSVLVWRIPWTEEGYSPQRMQRVRQDWKDSACMRRLLAVVCGGPILFFFFSLNHFKALSYKNPSGIAMEKPPAWVAWLHYPGSWVDLDQQSSWKICICFYSDALLLTNTKAIFSWRLPDCSIYFLLENVFSFVAISDTEKLSVSLFSLRETTP